MHPTLKLRAEANETNVGVPAVHEPEPVQVPSVAVPAKARDVVVAARVSPNGSRKDKVEFSPLLRDIVFSSEIENTFFFFQMDTFREDRLQSTLRSGEL